MFTVQCVYQVGCANEGISRAEAMFEITRDWVKQRKAFGRRVADLQTVSLDELQMGKQSDLHTVRQSNLQT